MSNQRIRATCPEHGDVEIYSENIFVSIDRDKRLSAAYDFLCADISDMETAHRVRKEAAPRIIDLLIASGIEAIEYSSELSESDIEFRRAAEKLSPIAINHTLATLSQISPEDLSLFLDQELS